MNSSGWFQRMRAHSCIRRTPQAMCALQPPKPLDKTFIMIKIKSVVIIILVIIIIINVIIMIKSRNVAWLIIRVRLTHHGPKVIKIITIINVIMTIKFQRVTTFIIINMV